MGRGVKNGETPVLARSACLNEDTLKGEGDLLVCRFMEPAALLGSSPTRAERTLPSEKAATGRSDAFPTAYPAHSERHPCVRRRGVFDHAERVLFKHAEEI